MTKDTIWKGDVTINEDILVPAGVTLTVAAGSHIRITAAESSKIDPEFLSPLNEIIVRGTLRVEGNRQSPVEFSAATGKTDSWAGLIIDRGNAFIAGCRISEADTAVQLIGGSLSLENSILTRNRYGIVTHGKNSTASVTNSQITANDYGLFILSGSAVSRKETRLEGNRKRDLYEQLTVTSPSPTKSYSSKDLPLAREYGDEALSGETVWQGRIRVNGIIRIPDDSRLIVLPGTIVEFSRRDSNGDGIGENGLLIQGRLIAKGTREAPIFFRSAEKQPRMGDWDSINIMNSDGSQNLIEYCQIEDGYRGTHFHFSNLSITNTVFRNNIRAMQFQESKVEIRDSWLYGNKSGVQGRDSIVAFNDTQVVDNYDGANFYRVHLTAKGNRFGMNLKEGLRMRESTATLTENFVDGNRLGLMIADAFHGSLNRNVISSNAEIGISLKNVDNLEVSGNFVTANGINGMNIQETGASIHGNLFAGNGERGIGILSFSGTLSGNNFASNGLFAIDYEGTADLTAPDNWWGQAKVEEVIGDKRIGPKRGTLNFAPASSKAHLITWPFKDLASDAFWNGAVRVDTTVIVPKGRKLAIAPGTRVFFGKTAGLTVQGTLIAEGKRGNMVLFTALEPAGDSSWGEIMLEYSEGSRIRYSIFEYATWGLHCHFTPLVLSNNLFRGNYGGMRFRSGPMQIIKSVFSGNNIGIRSYRGNAVIRENLITDNDNGIFVREKGSGLNISGNNLSANRGYGIRIGDFNDEDVAAQGNWWGSGDPQQYLFDGRTEPGIGKIQYDPSLREPPLLEELQQ